MSYIVSSNQQRDYQSSNTGLQNPNSYKNFFKSPLIIEPNSEIAVESVKMNRPYVFEVKANAMLYLYFGKELHAEQINIGVVTAAYTQVDTPRTTVPIYLTQGVYTPLQMAQNLQTQINLNPVHPQYFGRCSVEATYDAADKEFIGFKFQFSCIGAGTASHAQYGIIGEDDGEFAGTANSKLGATAGYSWTNTPLKFTCGTHVSGEESCSVLTRNPLSNGSTANGRSILEVKIQDAGALFKRTDGTGWKVGLCRATIGAINNGEPGLTETHGQAFFDYGVEMDEELGGLYVVEYNTGDFDTAGLYTTDMLRKRDLTYFKAGAPFVKRIPQADINASNLNSIRFALMGDEVKVAIGTNGGTFYDLVDFDNATLGKHRDFNFKPLNNNTEALYPKFQFTGQQRDTDCTMEVMAFETLNASVDFQKFNYPTLNEGKMVRGSDFFSSFTNQASDKLRTAGNNLIVLTDNRIACQANDIFNASAPFVYVHNNASGSVDYNHVIIQGNERGEGNQNSNTNIMYTLKSAAGATFPQEFGWSDVPVIEQSEFGASMANDLRNIQFVPNDNPDLIGGSLFVRVPNLEQTSYNGATNSISKILYHVPAFDNSGRSSGPLYHAPPEKTYIKLNNVERVLLNELNTDLVDRKEKITNSLIDNTTVCYHIRKSQ